MHQRVVIHRSVVVHLSVILHRDEGQHSQGNSNLTINKHRILSGKIITHYLGMLPPLQVITGKSQAQKRRFIPSEPSSQALNRPGHTHLLRGQGMSPVPNVTALSTRTLSLSISLGDLDPTVDQTSMCHVRRLKHEYWTHSIRRSLCLRQILPKAGRQTDNEPPQFAHGEEGYRDEI